MERLDLLGLLYKQTSLMVRVPGGLYNNPKPQPIFQSGLPTVLLVSIPMPLFASVDRFLHTGRYFGHCYEIVDSRGIYANKRLFWNFPKIV
jgi:hypothetical protein